MLAALSACTGGMHRGAMNAQSANGLVYDVVGRGPAVVLIHGTNLDRRLWDDDVAWLANGRTVIRYDLRGQGASPTPVERFSNHGDLLALLDELGIERASLVGLSSGVQVALDAALTAPARVDRLVLVSPSLAGFVPEPLPAFFADLGAALGAEDYDRANQVLLASPIMSVPPRHAERVRSMVEGSQRLWLIPYSLVELASPPALERLEMVGAPALVLTGENDLDAVQAQADLLERRMPAATRVTVTGGGHLLNLTSPDAFRRRVDGFLDAGR
jgi:pimeloyl-ACP methyl ester carboxylesterase